MKQGVSKRRRGQLCPNAEYGNNGRRNQKAAQCSGRQPLSPVADITKDRLEAKGDDIVNQKAQPSRRWSGRLGEASE